MDFRDGIVGAIGNTPLIRLKGPSQATGCTILGKAEFLNPAGSIKDRAAWAIIKDAEESGTLRPGGVIVEGTAGNTGIGIAHVANARGYRTVIVIPETQTQEKKDALRQAGASLIEVAAAPYSDDSNYIKYSGRLAAELNEKEPNGAIWANQFDNVANRRGHYETTGPEIWEQTGGKVTDVVIAMGTGGTISGVGRFLKEQNPDVQIVGVDATGSILKEIWENKGKIPVGVEANTYKVEGIGEDFLPSTTDLSVVDDIVRVTDKESFVWTRRLVSSEGIFAGGSSGSAVAGAVRYAKGLKKDRLVVVLLPDSGSRYLSKIFDDKWMRENGFLESEWGEVTLREVLQTKTKSEMVFASAEDKISDVVIKMKEYDISQVPVVNGNREVIGLVREVDLLTHLLENEDADAANQQITSILQDAPPSLAAHTRLRDAIDEIVRHNVVIVSDGGQPIGVLSKIDALDFIQR
ncbi:MAG: cysteine synthase A [Chloroflexi bacterium]|nr:cysteine synthase A [Chloroflexota bacterium]